MTEILLNEDLRAVRVELISARRAFWSSAAVPSFAGSVISFVAGLSISALAWTGQVADSRTTAYMAIGLLLSGFVLLFVGSHCMDRRDAAERSERVEKIKRDGFDVE